MVRLNQEVLWTPATRSEGEGARVASVVRITPSRILIRLRERPTPRDFGLRWVYAERLTAVETGS